MVPWLCWRLRWCGGDGKVTMYSDCRGRIKCCGGRGDVLNEGLMMKARLM